MVEESGFLKEVPFIKERILDLFLNDELLMKYISDTPDSILPARNMFCTHVYPWEYTLGTTQTASAYLTFEMTADAVTDERMHRNAAVLDLNLYVYAFCHQSIMLIDDKVAERLEVDERGTRLDLILSRVDELLNGTSLSRFGKFEFAMQEIILPPATDYPGKSNTYVTRNFNRMCGRL